MKLAFKRYGFGYSEKEVEITLKIATFEAMGEALNMEFGGLGNYAKTNPFDFRSELLYQGYIIACKDRYKKPKYDRAKAILWNDHLSKAAQDELSVKITELFGKIEKITGVKKKVK